MRAIIERSIPLDAARKDEFGIGVHPDDLKTLRVGSKALSSYRIKQLGETMARHGLGRLDVDEEPELFISAPHREVGWPELKIFLEGQGKSLRSLLCDLRFGLLD